MTRQEFKEWNLKADLGTVADELNPAFILSTTNSQLLSQIAQGKINLQELAKRELERRGLDINCKWQGAHATID